MRKVVIGFDKKGNPYVVSCPKKVEVAFKPYKKPTLKKHLKTAWYHVKTFFSTNVEA